jgi:hypothetical protein
MTVLELQKLGKEATNFCKELHDLRITKWKVTKLGYFDMCFVMLIIFNMFIINLLYDAKYECER